MRVDMSSAGILYTKQTTTVEETTYMRQEYVPSSYLLLVEQFVRADVAAVSSDKVNQYAGGAKALTSKTQLTSLQFDDANALEQ